MKIGIGLPATIPGVKPEFVLEWARKSDEGHFSTLGVLDRLVYPNYESMITLAAVAGVTQRARLMTTILIPPLRNAGVLAKQAATLDVISGGRLTLGVAVGSREDDFLVAPALYKGRGKRFEEQLALMKRIWSGEPVGEGVGPVGPPPYQSGGPELLIGGVSPKAISRVGRWANGFISPGSPDSLRDAYAIAEESWKAAGREGKPRLVGAAYYSLGPDAKEKGLGYLRDYYAFMGPGVDYMTQMLIATPEAVRGTIEAFSGIGMDELIFWPTVPDTDQEDHRAEIVG